MRRADETFIIGRIDRRRERAEKSAERTARTRALEARAASLLLSEIGELPAHEQADFAEHLAGAVRAQLVIHHGEASAASILSQQAAIAGANLLPKGAARDAAERLFIPANDRGPK